MSDHRTKYTATSLALGVLVVGLYLLSRHTYPLFHSLADGATVFIAASVFVVVWNRRSSLDSYYYLFVGIAFLFFAFLDFLHLLGNKGMGVFPSYGNLGPTLYIASRYVLGISLLLAPLFIKRKFNVPLVLALYSAVTALIILSIFYWRIFPVTYVEGRGLTPFKVVSDYIICAVLLLALGSLLLNRRWFDSSVLRPIAYSMVLSVATGLAFTLYSDPFGITNAVGHILQIGSFYLVYVAFVETTLTKPQDTLYRNLKQSREQVLELNARLEEANLDLKHDISERQKVEKTLRRYAQDLESANRELESFSYTVSHDLRAPLRSIDGFSGALLEDYSEKLDDQGKKWLRSVRASSVHMGQLINDILGLSRVGRAEMKSERVDLSELARSTARALEEAEPGRKAEFVIAPGVEVTGDRNLLELVLQNLLGNAFKFTSRAESARIEFGSREQDDDRVYFVRDNGSGFDMKYADKLFQPFQRLHRAEEYSGTGIGLATVQKIIQRHGGTVWATGEVNKGAAFYFTLGNGKA